MDLVVETYTGKVKGYEQDEIKGYGIDGIFTNYPDKLVELRSGDII